MASANRFQKADPYRLEFLKAPIWTWSNNDWSFRLYTDKTLVRRYTDEDIAKYIQFYPLSFSDHRFISYKLTLDMIHRLGF